MPEPVHHQVNAARKTFQTLHQISKLLNTNLDPATLSICVRLCENGVNPQALATVVKELQREVKALEGAESAQSVKNGYPIYSKTIALSEERKFSSDAE